MTESPSASDNPPLDAVSLYETVFQGDPWMFDAIQYEIARKLMHFGQHFTGPLDRPSSTARLLKKQVCQAVLRVAATRQPPRTHQIAFPVISNAYGAFNEQLRTAGRHIMSPPWERESVLTFWKEPSLQQECISIRDRLNAASVGDLLGPQWAALLNQLRKRFADYLARLRPLAVVVPFDLPLFENVLLLAASDVGVKSFTALHGLPGVITPRDNFRGDYFLVWSNRIKRLYKSHGFHEDRIIVTGHPLYGGAHPRPVQTSVANPLVLSQSVQGARLTGLMDHRHRECIAAHALLAQIALQRCGVSTAILRPHPGHSVSWVKSVVDQSFYTVERSSLSEALTKASVVIGPVSTVLLDALAADRNYVVFEPELSHDKGILPQLIPPFDSDGGKVPLARSVMELVDILKSNVTCDASLLNEWAGPKFSPDFLGVAGGDGSRLAAAEGGA